MPADAPLLDADGIDALGIQGSNVQQRETSLFGVTSPESKVADLRPSHVLLTRSDIHFITLRKGDNRYLKELSLPLTRIQSTSLVRYGNMGHLRQIHLMSDLGLVVMSFGFGETHRAEKFFESLKDSGLKVAAGSGYVRGVDDARGMVPIFIPSR
jgi:hypothetical protein